VEGARYKLACSTKDPKIAAAAIVVVILLGSSLLASAAQQHLTSAQSNIVIPPISSPAQHWGFTSGQQDAANSSTRAEIMSFIVANPGVYLRELCEDLDLSMGVVQYHVWALVKSGEVEDYRGGRYRRFFEATAYQQMEQKVISLMRQQTTGRILLLLSKDEPISHARLAALIGVTSQALTWQVGRLRMMGIIEARSARSGVGMPYRLAEGLSQLVSTYQQAELQAVACLDASHALVTQEAFPTSTRGNSNAPASSGRVQCYDHFIVEPKKRRA
jgi:predicted ArsR family transcriptional regulator